MVVELVWIELGKGWHLFATVYVYINVSVTSWQFHAWQTNSWTHFNSHLHLL